MIVIIFCSENEDVQYEKCLKSVTGLVRNKDSFLILYTNFLRDVEGQLFSGYFKLFTIWCKRKTFCEESLCTYCGCNTRITKNHSVEQPYIDAVLKEWAAIFQKKTIS